MASVPIYNMPLRALDHRLLWLLLSWQQKKNGKPTGFVKGPWRELARLELKTHRPLMWAAEKRLRDNGVLIVKPYSQDAVIDGRVFG